MTSITECIAMFPTDAKYQTWSADDKRALKSMLKTIGWRKTATETKKSRSPSAYNMYNKAQFVAIKQSLQASGVEPKHPDVVKAVASSWKNLSDEEKKEWIEKAAEQKASHMSDSGSETEKKGRAPSAYNLYNKAQFASIKAELGEGANARDVMREIAKRWQLTSAEDKAEYIALAKEAKEVHDATKDDSASDGEKKPMTAYKVFAKTNKAHFKKSLLDGGAEANTKAVNAALKSAWAGLTAEEREPFETASGPVVKKVKSKNDPKRARTAYNYFSKTQSGPVKQMMEQSGLKVSQTEIMTKIAAAWKAMSEEDKQPYVEMSQQDKIRYDEEKTTLAS